MRRRLLLALLGAACLAPGAAFAEPGSAAAAWSPRDGERLVFDVLRNGGPFGRHVVAFSRDGDRLLVKTDIELKVAMGPVTLFHYVHQASETWTGGALHEIIARTKNKGRWKELAVRAADGGLEVVGAAFRGRMPGGVIPSTHWNIEQMRRSAMLSTETGEMLPMTVTDLGVETILAGGRQIPARRFRVDSDVDADFWYDASGRWVKCAFRAEGSDVEYVLRS